MFVHRNTVLLFILLASIAISSCDDKVRLKNPVLQRGIKRFYKNDYSDNIDSICNFSERFINAYKKIVNDKVNPHFYDSLNLGNSSFQVKIFISNTRDLFINILKSKKNEVDVDATVYPIQTALIFGLDIFGKRQLLSPLSEYLSYYDTAHFLFNVELCKECLFETVTMAASFPDKLLQFGNNQQSVPIFSNLTLIGLQNNIEVNRFKINGVGMFFRNNNVYNLNFTPESIADFYTTSQIENLFIKSSFFRELMGEDSLYPMAAAMEEKLKADEIQGTHNYSLALFNDDYDKLQKKAIGLRLNVDFTNSVILEAKARNKSGLLLFYYKDFKDLMWKWTILNGCMILLMWLFYELWKKYDLFKNIASTHSPKAIILGVNSYLLAKITSFLPLQFWILPGIFFILGVILSFYWFKKTA